MSRNPASLDSPPVAPGRRILAGFVCLTLALGSSLMLGCGSESNTDVSFSQTASGDFQNKLDVVQAFLADENCERATEAVGGLTQAVAESSETSEDAKAQLTELLGTLDEQIAEECAALAAADPADTESTTTTTTEEDPTSTESTTTSTTTTSTTDSTETTPPEDEEEPEIPVIPPETETPGNSPVSPPGQSGSGGTESGGIEAGRQGTSR